MLTPPGYCWQLVWSFLWFEKHLKDNWFVTPNFYHLTFLKIPGLGFFYGGITRKNNKLTLLCSSVLSLATVTIQWYIFGYSLSFSKTSTSSFIGDFCNKFSNMMNKCIACLIISYVSKTMLCYLTLRTSRIRWLPQFPKTLLSCFKGSLFNQQISVSVLYLTFV